MKLRTLIFGALVLISALPVGILAYWQHRVAVNNEFTVVENQHQVIAKNLTIALERYARDTRAAFQLASENLQNPVKIKQLEQLLAELQFRHVCSIDASGNIQQFQCALICPKNQQFPEAVLLTIKDTIQAATYRKGEVFFSKVVHNPIGEPAIYLVKKMADGTVAIGEIKPSYFIELQKAVAFGVKGHAAIVDQKGRVIAHPLPGWVQSMKDLSSVSIVQKMINGESGVTRFYSPAVKANMVAGYNVVTGTGWGVMVPQPQSEIFLQTTGISKVALTIAILGVLVASFFGWWISGILSKPMQLLSKAAYSVAVGNLSKKEIHLTKLGPAELQNLEKSFNQMIANVLSKNAELEKLSHDAIRASKYKSEFISSMNHELRTPMNSVLGFAQMLKLNTEEPLSKTQRTSIENILRNGNYLLELIDQMLDFNRIEEGELLVEIDEVPARDVIEASLCLVESQAGQTGIEIIDQTVGEDLPLLSTDSTRLIQVLLNLLSNAIKYNSEGGTVTLGCQRTPSQMLRINIIDTGIGIPTDQQDNLFNPFERLGHELGEIEGAGIGLSISKKLVELLGGQIGFESEQGRGSTFWVEVPLSTKRSSDQRDARAADTTDLTDTNTSYDSSTYSILYIEDNPENIKLMETIFDKIENTRLLTVNSATAGFDLATSKKPDLILMDINLTGMNGLQALKQLRRTRETKDIPVIAITSNSLPKDIEAGLKAGFKAYITKPIKISNFISQIEKTLDKIR